MKNTDFIPNAVLDANVLYPIYLRDFACWLQWHGAHRMVWSVELGLELRRALSRTGLDSDLADRVWSQLNLAFHDNLKELRPWTPLGLPDADDEHIAQLALQQCPQGSSPRRLLSPRGEEPTKPSHCSRSVHDLLAKQVPNFRRAAAHGTCPKPPPSHCRIPKTALQ